MTATRQTSRLSSVLRGPMGTGTIIAVLALVIFFARYLHLGEFGLYVDDYTRIPAAMGMEPQELYEVVSNFVFNFGGQGRPLHPSFIYILGFIGGQIGDITSLYQIGYLIFLLNTLLLYVWFKRIAGQTFAVFGALAFLLFPADTTQIFLTHALGLQPAVTFFLLASLAYFSNRRLLAYVFILGTLLTYETLFTVFLVVPLLQRRWDRKLLRELGLHWVVMFALGSAVVLLRLSVGEERVLGLSPAELIISPFLHMVQGTIVSMGTFLYRPYQVLTSLSIEIVAVLILATVGFFWIFSRLQPEGWFNIAPLRKLLQRRQVWSETNGQFKYLMELFASGVLMLALAYPLTFTIRAHAISGRDTRVHFAAAIGAALLCAWTASILIAMAQRTRYKGFVNALLSVAFAMLVGYGLVVQRDYVASWTIQREFWTELVSLAPDLGDGTVIIVDPEALQDVRQIDANTWNLPRVLSQIYAFPESWQTPPQVYRLIPGWQDQILTEDNQLRVDALTTISPTSSHQSVDSSRVVFITGTPSDLVRVGPTIDLSGTEILLKLEGKGSQVPTRQGFLYEYMLGRDDG